MLDSLNNFFAKFKLELLMPKYWHLLFTSRIFSINAHYLICAYCLSAAISIAMSQILVISLLLYWLGNVSYRQVSNTNKSCEIDYKENENIIYNKWLSYLLAPVLTWFFISLLSSLYGINTIKTLTEVLKTSVYLLFPFCVYDILNSFRLSFCSLLKKIITYLICLGCSQSAAAILSIVLTAIGSDARLGLPGAVTESGQLALVIPAILGLLLLHTSNNSLSSNLKNTSISGLLELVLFISLILFAWTQNILKSENFYLTLFVQSLALALIISIVFIYFYETGLLQNALNPQHVSFHKLITIILLLLFVALIINLKRGPWLGIFVSLSIFGFFTSRRIAWLIISSAIILLLFLAPVRDRLLTSSQHFFIDGGRKTMWSIGVELVQRFPLGVGLENASFMRALDPTLPYIHRHMHNNFLNIAVETGLMGLGAYLWWMISIILLGFFLWNKTSNTAIEFFQAKIITLSLSCAIISWQVAGLVEYNFGDGEVRMIAFFLMGLIIVLVKMSEQESVSMT